MQQSPEIPIVQGLIPSTEARGLALGIHSGRHKIQGLNELTALGTFIKAIGEI